MADRLQLELGDYLPYLINRVGAALVDRFVAEKLSGAGLGIADWRVLVVLSTRGAQRQVDVAEQTSIDVSTLSRLIARMVRNGFVTRERAPHNNREVLVQLTAKGRAVMDRLIPHGRQLETIAVEGLNERELDIVRRSLRQMYGNLTQRPAGDTPQGSVSKRSARKGV